MGNSQAKPTAASMSDYDFVKRIASKAEAAGIRKGVGPSGELVIHRELGSTLMLKIC